MATGETNKVVSGGETPQTNSKPTSHDYARELQRVADFLLARESFDWPYTPSVFTPLHCWDKENFLALVKGLGTGTKKFTEREEVEFTAVIGQHESKISVYIPRDKICRLVRPAEFDCEPFLSALEEAQLGGGQ